MRSPKRFPNIRQLEAKDCGPTCLRIIAKHYGKDIPLEYIIRVSETTREGTNLMFLSKAAESIGFETLMASVSFEQLIDIDLPCIAFWDARHFVVIYKIDSKQVWISDPALGLVRYSHDEFKQKWIGPNRIKEEGVVLLLEPTDLFHSQQFQKQSDVFTGNLLWGVLKRYRRALFYIYVGVFASILIQFSFPFLTQLLVDQGIDYKSYNIIAIILCFQLVLFLGRFGFEVHRRWALLHLSTRVSLTFLAKFFEKLTRLPISYYDVKLTGDLMQRIIDHRRVNEFVVSSTVTIIYSLISFLVFSIVLLIYSPAIFAIFLVGTAAYVGWIMLFLQRRAHLDNVQFHFNGKVTSATMEMINGMQEIKLNNADKKRRASIEWLQLELFGIAERSLNIEQWQLTGSGIINEFKNAFILAVGAALVINGEMTLGTLLAISFVVGQLNGPLGQILTIIRQSQDTLLSLRRINEIHRYVEQTDGPSPLAKSGDIQFERMSFKYPGKVGWTLSDITFSIPENKITAIVGASGSGKTTLMKLILKFYSPTTGLISVNGANIQHLDSKTWWDQCGIVMQEGFIFNDTIANNIAVGTEFNPTQLKRAAKIACIDDLIHQLPSGFDTVIGQEGLNLSTGQKQRILIARAVYKNPKLLLFDEATSSLDANNERAIMKNLDSFFEDRTVVIIAHRLSTVMKADQIIVLKDGQLIEIGNHDQLLLQGGYYYQLVKNQLDIEKIAND